MLVGRKFRSTSAKHNERGCLQYQRDLLLDRQQQVLAGFLVRKFGPSLFCGAQNRPFVKRRTFSSMPLSLSLSFSLLLSFHASFKERYRNSSNPGPSSRSCSTLERNLRSFGTDEEVKRSREIAKREREKDGSEMRVPRVPKVLSVCSSSCSILVPRRE